jgi:hypothetical protein
MAREPIVIGMTAAMISTSAKACKRRKLALISEENSVSFYLVLSINLTKNLLI